MASKSSNGNGSADGDGGDGPPYAARALALMEPDWSSLGKDKDGATVSSLSTDDIVEDVTALLLVRLVCIVAPLGTYPDLSVASVCKNVIQKHRDWPLEVTDEVIRELREFVARTVKGYKPDVPYHNQEHAHHVVLSTCKLLDLMLFAPPVERRLLSRPQQQQQAPPSYGLRNDPLMLFAQVFAALIHDAEHQGLANRQLAQEKDRLAVLYNDQSIAENWSLYVAFSEFLQDEFAALRQVLFESNLEASPAGRSTPALVYLQFRKAVINLVLCTDIASPERTQIGKSKWKEAFGDPYETVERKMRAEQLGQRRRSLLTGREFNMPNIHEPPHARRGTAQSGYSELTGSDGGMMMAMPGDEDSLSGTPEGSVTRDDSAHNEEDNLMSPLKTRMSGVGKGSVGNSDQMKVSHSPNKSVEGGSHSSGGGGDRHLGGGHSTSHSGTGGTANSAEDRKLSKWERRMSTTSRTSTATARYRQRLGILRTVDLSGETIENYSAAAGGGSSRHPGTASVISSDHAYTVDLDADETDTLKAEVLMETIMTAADVAHNLQGWDQMAKWSNRLYLELRKAYVARRGMDAQPRWFENQIGFLESYLLPLAHRLEDTGVFPADLEFARVVEDNRDRWLTEGYDVATDIIKKGAELYPDNSN